MKPTKSKFQSAWRSLSLHLTSVFLLLLLAASAGCRKEPESRPIVVGYLPIIAHLPILVAKDQGYLADIPLEMRVFGSSNDLLASLAKNDVNFTTTVAMAPVAAREVINFKNGKESDVRVFSYSETTAEEPFDSVFVASSSPIASLADLKGKRVGLFPGTTAKNILALLLQTTASIPKDSVQWVFLPPNLQIEALKSGDIDALYTYETTRTVAEINGLKKIHGSVIASILNKAPYGCSAVNRVYEANNPDTCKKLIEALDKAVLFIRTNPEECRRILQTEQSLPQEVASKCNLERRFTSTEVTEAANIQRLQEFIGKLVEAGELRDTFDAKKLVK